MSEPDPAAVGSAAGNPAADDPFDGLTRPLALPDEQAEQLLSRGELAVEGRLVDASNATFYCSVTLEGVSAAAVYKPVAGERPLWDFPDGTLAEREVAAYQLSRCTRWQIVPPTVFRDGPAGPGMVQLWIDTDPLIDVVDLVRGGETSLGLQRVAILDVVLNNADRKGGHLLPVSELLIKGCDHGLTFHTEDKLRTVLWHWAGCPLPDWAVETLIDVRAAVVGGLGTQLAELLTTREVRHTIARVDRLLRRGVLPQPPDSHRAIPWPPF